jgi:hypothetical protein
MLDVHPPHERAHTWTDFFVHIATIAVGLLIALGLEQAVEFIHHRHQVAELRQSLVEERRINQLVFEQAAAEFRRFSPLLRGMLETTRYLRQHPGTPENQWPGRYHFYIYITSFQDSAWRTAQESGVLQYMPRTEVSIYSDLYARLQLLSEGSDREMQALARAKASVFRTADPTSLTGEQLDQAFDSINQIRVELMLMGIRERNLSSSYPDFRNPPSDAELYGLVPPAPDPKDVAELTRMSQAIRSLTEQQKLKENAPHR